jgi:hypothetical protein
MWLLHGCLLTSFLWQIAIHVGGHCGYEIFPLVPHVVQVRSLWMHSSSVYRHSSLVCYTRAFTADQKCLEACEYTFFDHEAGFFSFSTELQHSAMRFHRIIAVKNYDTHFRRTGDRTSLQRSVPHKRLQTSTACHLYQQRRASRYAPQIPAVPFQLVLHALGPSVRHNSSRLRAKVPTKVALLRAPWLCMRKFMHGYIYVCTCICAFVCVYVCVYVRMYDRSVYNVCKSILKYMDKSCFRQSSPCQIGAASKRLRQGNPSVHGQKNLRHGLPVILLMLFVVYHRCD